MVHCDSSDHNVLHLASSDETVMARFGIQIHVRTPIVNLSAVIIAHTGIIMRGHSAYSMFHEIVWTDRASEKGGYGRTRTRTRTRTKINFSALFSLLQCRTEAKHGYSLAKVACLAY